MSHKHEATFQQEYTLPILQLVVPVKRKGGDTYLLEVGDLGTCKLLLANFLSGSLNFTFYGYVVKSHHIY